MSPEIVSARPAILLLVANSARALAESAVRGGYRVHVLDGFCDCDTQALAPCTPIPLDERGLDAACLESAVERLIGALPTADGPVALVYGAGLESCPALLARLQRHVAVLGNAPEVPARLGEPAALLRLLDALGIAHPQTRLEPPPADGGAWLVKETGTCGGLGVRPWRPGDPRPVAPHYFQRRLAGEPMSVLFVADGRRHVAIGFNRLLIADGGAERPYLYGGALGQAEPQAAVRQTLEAWCAALTERLGLRGINGIDFLLHQGRPWFLELNARPPASLSLYESSCPEGWIDRHVRACRGALPTPAAPAPGRVWGQRVVYAPRDLDIPPDLCWPHDCRDLPAAGSRVSRGAPLCTVLADAAEPAGVESRLAERAARVLRQLDAVAPPGALP